VNPGDVPGLEAVERKGTSGQHRVEDLGLERREEEADLAAVAGDRRALEERARTRRIRRALSEALRSEAIGHAPRRHLGEQRCHALGLGEAAQGELEAVSPQLPGAELVGMAGGLEHPHALALQGQGALGIEPRNREPLSRNRDPVLAPGVAHLRRPHPGDARELPAHLLGVAKALLHAEERVPPLAAGPIQGDLVDHEILGRGDNPGQGVSFSSVRRAAGGFEPALSSRLPISPAGRAPQA
jgi:hypothetical protein